MLNAPSIALQNYGKKCCYRTKLILFLCRSALPPTHCMAYPPHPALHCEIRLSSPQAKQKPPPCLPEGGEGNMKAPPGLPKGRRRKHESSDYYV